MNRIVLACTGAALIAAAGAGLAVSAVAEANHPPIYYQDPDGKPDYSPTPKKTPDGRESPGLGG